MTLELDRMITSAEIAAAQIRWRAQMTQRPAPIADRLTRPRRGRHRRTPIDYRPSPAEFIISGTACSILGGVASVVIAQILFGVWS